MSKWLRRLFWLAVLSGAGFAVWTALQRRDEPLAPTDPSARPTPRPPDPLAQPAAPAVAEPSPSEPVSAPDEAAEQAPPDETVRWRTPVDGACPDGFPIKVARSGIYHVPGGRSYERTVANRCYASAEDAEADGYRRAKA